jgi:hypothetical protein
MKDLGRHHFLGVSVTKKPHGLHLSQQQCFIDICSALVWYAWSQSLSHSYWHKIYPSFGCWPSYSWSISISQPSGCTTLSHTYSSGHSLCHPTSLSPHALSMRATFSSYQTKSSYLKGTLTLGSTKVLVPEKNPEGDTGFLVTAAATEKSQAGTGRIQISFWIQNFLRTFETLLTNMKWLYVVWLYSFRLHFSGFEIDYHRWLFCIFMWISVIQIFLYFLVLKRISQLCLGSHVSRHSHPFSGQREYKILILVIKKDNSGTRTWDLHIEMPWRYHCGITS